ncbi:MAG: SPASM domain-containing protein [Bacteroidia bacterium]|nr:SPASM domain-containing protein [Bacteroidia bacterium]
MIPRTTWNRIILRSVTPKRLFNALLLLVSYHFSRLTRRAWMPARPAALAVEPTTSCNLRCPECPSGLRSFTRPTGMLDAELFQQIVDQNAAHSAYLTFYFQGEPYLHPKFTDMVKYAAAKKMVTVTSTNAHYLNEENARKTVASGLSKLIISLDGITQETYAAYRIGGKLNTVLEGARNVLRMREEMKSATPFVTFQFLVVRANEHEVEAARTLAQELGADEIVFKTAQLYDYENGNPLMPENEEFSRYVRTPGGKYKLRGTLLNQCWKMWHSCVITWDGKVVPCCFDKDAAHQLGDLAQQPLTQVWKSAPYNNFRKAILQSRSSIDICANCSEGTKVFAQG